MDKRNKDRESQGSFVISKETWEQMPPEERDWVIFNTLNQYRRKTDSRISSLEGRRKENSVIAAIGGVVGGFLAFFGVKFFNS